MGMKLLLLFDIPRVYLLSQNLDLRLTINPSGFVAPKMYNGTASITQIYTQVNATNWLMVYKCTRCLIFDDPSQTSFNTSTSAGLFEQGWAQSSAPPDDPTNADSEILQHNNGMGEFKVEVASAIQASYLIWATMTVTGTSTSGTVQPTSTGNATRVRSSTSSTGITTAPSTACTAATRVAVTFNEMVTTDIGQTIKIAGSISELGDWDTNSAPALSADRYTSSDHLWTYTVTLSAGENFQYKFINVQSSGTVDWESDPNRSFTVPESCATAVTINDSWR
jgi:Starch binding domain/Cytochrome domain of cellobiose dehydrogenase